MDIKNFLEDSYSIKIPSPDKGKDFARSGAKFRGRNNSYFSVREPSFETVDSSQR